MSMAVDYYQWHQHFMLNSSYIDDTTKFLLKNAKRFHFDEPKTMISIGPGYGKIDAAIINKCTQLEHYIGVDPDQFSLGKLSSAIVRRPNLKVSLVHAEYPDWKGPEKGIDLVLVSHVLYYITDRVAAFKKFYDWLNPGGCIIILNSGQNLYKDIAKSYIHNVQFYIKENLREDLREAGFHNFEEFELKSTLHAASQNDEMVKSHFRNMVSGIPEEEMDNLVQLFRKHCDKNGYDLDLEYVCIRLVKPQ